MSALVKSTADFICKIMFNHTPFSSNVHSKLLYKYRSNYLANYNWKHALYYIINVYKTMTIYIEKNAANSLCISIRQCRHCHAGWKMMLMMLLASIHTFIITSKSFVLLSPLLHVIWQCNGGYFLWTAHLTCKFWYSAERSYSKLTCTTQKPEVSNTSRGRSNNCL